MKKRYLTSFKDQTSALDYINGDTTLMFPHVSIVGDGEVVYSKEIPNNKNVIFAKDETTGKLYFTFYAEVDLGLPSGIKWADKNVGAKTPWDNGAYFSWGNVDGHTVDENGKTKDGYIFEINQYATTYGGQYTGTTLDAEHDAATVNMGEDWRMPTSTETTELVQNTDHYYIGEDGNIVDKSELDNSIKLRSICFVKKGEAFDYNNRSNFIEFPFAGNCYGPVLNFVGLYGNFFSSSIDEISSVENALGLNFNNNGYLNGDSNCPRYYGQTVRGVHA